MQHVNDDMDELFRRAAENYPLDTNSANWNKVLAAMQDQNQAKTTPEKKRKNNGRFLWLLLLLPLGLICNQLYSPGDLDDKTLAKSGGVKQNQGGEKSKALTKTSDKRSAQSGESSQDKQAGVQNTTLLPGKNSKGKAFQPGDVNSSKANRSKKTDTRVYAGLKNSFSSNELNDRSTNVTTGDQVNEDFLSTRQYISGIPYRKLEDQPSNVPGRALNPTINSPSGDVKSEIRVTKSKKFYAGLIGGLDATTIKFQKIEDVGFNYGLLLGYQFNKKWSIETGAYLEKKYYYSDAKYFNTSKMNLPPNTWIDDVSGYCKMIEVPLAARYNFGIKKQSNWFGVMGLSSYFMMQENYTYNYYYGTVGPVPHAKEYKNSSTHIFSNLMVSGGYSQKLGGFADLRIEPYLKLPISGTGYGSLPLFSTGLQVGLTKKF